VKARGVDLCILNLGADTSAATGRLMFTVIGAIACFERELMLERQREGIAKAQAEGKYKGRKPTARARAAEIVTLKTDGVRPVDIARRLGIGRASVYRLLVVRTTSPMRSKVHLVSLERLERDRGFADSSVEGKGFEPSVPLLRWSSVQLVARDAG
jgi:hypothetical protein